MNVAYILLYNNKIKPKLAPLKFKAIKSNSIIRNQHDQTHETTKTTLEKGECQAHTYIFSICICAMYADMHMFVCMYMHIVPQYHEVRTYMHMCTCCIKREIIE